MDTSKTLRLIALSASVMSLSAPLYAFANTATQNPASSTWTGTLPIAAHGPFQRVYMPQNAPSAANRDGFPREWTSAYANARHNAAFPVGNDAPKWLRQGVGWNFAEARAWPLSDKIPFGNGVYGEREALPVQTQFMGNALGVTAVDGTIYGESDDMFAYAVNARTGQLIWRTSPVQNNLMGDPVVAGRSVYLSAGSVSFNFAHVVKYAQTGKTSRGEDESFNGVISLNRNTGKFQWMFLTKGEAMPTPAYAHGKLYVSTGAGNIFAINAKDGKKIWKTHVGGIANMSDPAVYDGRVYVSMSVVPYIYCLNAKTGKVLWKQGIKGAVNTGLGDVAPAVANGIVVQDTVVDKRVKNGHKTVNTTVQAMSAKTGKILWSHNMGRGPLPPAFKGGMPMIHGGVVYVGTPVNSVYQARNLKTGKLLWTWSVPDAGPAGAGRGAATYYDGALYVSTGPYVYALNSVTGTELGKHYVGGRFGIVNPTIVGGTIYLGNSWDWINALPVDAVNPHYKG
ncbi:MAG: PQQ-binding-like beta-propeller repeat protein [Acidihalobacter sp.]|uniref:outer membrane protein assembly factor BamB family protein n=1 Tax=Acidihalobacter sp. TaxID=1872108 RepID=UPI00307E26ED